MYKFAPENLRQSLSTPPHPSPPSRAGKLSLHSVTGLDPGTPSFPTRTPHSFTSPPHVFPAWAFPSPPPSAAEDAKETLTPFLEACFDSLSGAGARQFASLFVYLTSLLHRGHRLGCFYRLSRLGPRPAGVQPATALARPFCSLLFAVAEWHRADYCLQVEAMVAKDATLALAASAADDKCARREGDLVPVGAGGEAGSNDRVPVSAGGEAGSVARMFSRVRMEDSERSVAA
jgi:hypothetical protein